MRRILSIAAAVLVLAQALAASVPMLHPPAAQKAVHQHGKHDCCPKPVVEVRNCCPKVIACPHQKHSAGACCCAESGGAAIPSRKTMGDLGPAVTALPSAADPYDVQHGWMAVNSPGPPLDNSPPILVLRN